jgi:hypothetical protein
MAHPSKNKMKYWRKYANKVTIQVPKTRVIQNEAGEEVTESYDEPVTLTGRQLRQYVVPMGKFKQPTGLLKNLMQNAGCYTINLDDVIVTGE